MRLLMPQRGIEGGEPVIRLVKRYGSRKLYDTEESRYVSLEELSTWIREGQQIRVLNKETGEDMTSQTLTQVIVEAGRRDSAFPPSDLLHEIIRRGGEFFTSGVEQVGSGLDRLLQPVADQVPPLRQVRDETELLPLRNTEQRNVRQRENEAASDKEEP